MNILKKIFRMDMFNPHITDANYSLRERVLGRNIVLMNYGTQHITLMQACFDKVWKFQKAKNYSFNDILLEQELINYSEDKLIAISYGDKVSIITEIDNNRNNPYSIRSESQKYSINTRFNETQLIDLQKKYKEMGFCVLKIQITALNLLNCMLAEELQNNVTTLIIDQGYIFGVRICNGIWSQVRSIALNNNEQLRQAIENLINKDTEVVQYWNTNSNDTSFLEIAKTYNFDNKLKHWNPSNFSTAHPELELLTYE